MRLPRWLPITIGIVPLVAIFIILVIAVARPDRTNPGNLATYTSTGEAEVLRPLAGDFTLKLFDGSSATLSSLKGKVVMLDFWGSWCVPCRTEAVEVQRSWEIYRDKGVVFLGINVFDNDSAARGFIKEFGVSYLNGADPKGSIAVDFGLTGVPEKYFLDRSGRIVKKFVGPMTQQRLATVLDQVLAAQS